MLITAIQLHSKGKQYYSIGNIVVLAIFGALAIIFYFVSIRGGLKKYERDQKTGTPPQGSRIISQPGY